MDIELVIKIDEEQYKFIKQSMTIDAVKNYPALLYNILESIQNGTSLPTGHDRLIEANSVDKIVKPIEPSDAEWGMTGETAIRLIHDAFDRAPTILEADKENK